MENGVAVTGQAVFGKFVKLREQERAGLLFGARQDAGIEFLKELGIAGKETAIEEREMKFDVVFFDALAFLERASGGADPEAEVPQSAGKVGDQGAEGLLGFFVAEEEKDVEVRIGEEQTASVPTEGEQAQAFGRRVVDTEDIAENLA